jgi:hypothetical protein
LTYKNSEHEKLSPVDLMATMGKRKGKVKKEKSLPPITVTNVGDFKVIRRRAD